LCLGFVRVLIGFLDLVRVILFRIRCILVGLFEPSWLCLLVLVLGLVYVLLVCLLVVAFISLPHFRALVRGRGGRRSDLKGGLVLPPPFFCLFEVLFDFLCNFCNYLRIFLIIDIVSQMTRRMPIIAIRIRAIRQMICPVTNWIPCIASMIFVSFLF